MKLVERRMTRAEAMALPHDELKLKLSRRSVRASAGTDVLVLTAEAAMLRDRMEKWAREAAKTAPPEVTLDDLDGAASCIQFASERSLSFTIMFYVKAKP